MLRVSMIASAALLGVVLAASSAGVQQCVGVVEPMFESIGQPCLGQATLSLGGCATPGGTVFVSIDGLVLPSAGLLLVGFAPGATPMPFGCTVHMTQLFPSPLPFFVSPQIPAGIFGQIPHDAAGKSIYLQAILLPNDMPGISIPSFTNAMRMNIS